MSLSAAIRSQVSEALDTVETLIAAVEAGEYTSLARFEAAANDARQALTTARLAASAELGARAWTLQAAIEVLGRCVLELRGQVSGADDVVVEAITQQTSLMEIAWHAHGDFRRWPELLALNPHFPAPWAIPAGTQVTRRAR